MDAERTNAVIDASMFVEEFEPLGPVTWPPKAIKIVMYRKGAMWIRGGFSEGVHGTRAEPSDDPEHGRCSSQPVPKK